MKNDNAITKAEPMPISGASGALGMIGQLIEKGITPDNVAAIKELRALYIDEENREAERQFNAAFVALQSELPPIHPNKEVKGRNGEVMYSYAPYEEIMEQITPLLKKHGFAVTFTSKHVEGRAVAICKLMHTAGHKETNEYAVKPGGGQSWLTDAQRDGSAMTYAQRNALCNCFNIVRTGQDNDANDIGLCVTPDQAEDLRQRVTEGKANSKVFLECAQAKSYETIPASRYEDLSAQLKRKYGV